MLNHRIRYTLRCLLSISPRVTRKMQKGCIKYMRRPAIADSPHSNRVNIKPILSPLPPGVPMSSNITREFALLLTTLFAVSAEAEKLEEKHEISGTPISKNTNMVPVKKISDFESVVYGAGEKLVILFIMVRWCPFCRKIAPTVEQIAAMRSENVVVLKLDMDDKEADSTKIVAMYDAYHLQKEQYAVSLPTFVFMKRGSKLEHFSSADEQKLLGTVDKYTKLNQSESSY